MKREREREKIDLAGEGEREREGIEREREISALVRALWQKQQQVSSYCTCSPLTSFGNNSLYIIRAPVNL